MGSEMCIRDSKIYVGSTDASLHAYYPYGKVTFGANSTVTALTVKDHTADNDFCYADAPLTAVNNRTPVASFLLKHAYAGLKFSIACHSTYLEEVQVDQNSDATCNEWKNILCGT